MNIIVHFFFQKDKEDLEPLFVIEEEKLPMHIKYITLQMPNSVKKDRSLPRKLCACGCLVTTIIILSVALVLLVELVFDKNQQKQPLFLTVSSIAILIGTHNLDLSHTGKVMHAYMYVWK